MSHVTHCTSLIIAVFKPHALQFCSCPVSTSVIVKTSRLLTFLEGLGVLELSGATVSVFAPRAPIGLRVGFVLDISNDRTAQIGQLTRLGSS